MNWYCFWKDFIIALTSALIIAAAAVFSVKQFYNQKWWEKKAESYSKISEDLSRLFFCVSEQYDESIGVKELTGERLGQLWREYRRRLESSEMVWAGGAFIISKDVHREFDVLIKTLSNNHYKEQEEPYSDYIGRDFEAIKNFRDSFNKLAKRDLKIK